MVYKKRGLLLVVFWILLLSFFSCVSSLGVSPAKVEINFQPNYEKDISYRVGRVSQDMPIVVSVEGDLAKYVKIDKNNFTGPGTFNVHLKLPSEIEIPGKHRIKIVVAERPDIKKVRDMISTSVVIKVVIDIFVPYPGKYLEISEFKANNVNVGETVEFDLALENKGKEDLERIFPRIDISSQGERIKILDLGEYSLETTKKLNLRDSFNTSGYNPGIYEATAIVDYDGGFAKKNITFRIGDLIVYIRDYTKNVSIGGFKRFNIDVESGWNNNIDGVYADVILLNRSGKLQEFKTSTESLTPWQKKTIVGYINTTGFSPGEYDANITVYYYGKEQGKSINKIVKVNFVEPTYSSMTIYIFAGIGAVVFVILVLFIVKIFLKSKSKKK